MENINGLTSGQIKNLLDGIIANIPANVQKILLIPPDYTRKHSGAGKLTAKLYQLLTKNDLAIDILPALGTHQPMSNEELIDMFGEKIPPTRYIVHNWRQDTVKIGKIPADFVNEITEGIVKLEIDVEINQLLLSEDYDLIISLGQVLPHEVAGMANYYKNILVGTGGVDIINKSHFVGAAYGMERVLGKDHSPVHKIFDYAGKHFLQDIPLLFILTVNSININEKTGLTDTLGIYTGRQRQVFEKAIALSQQVNINWLNEPEKKVVVFLDEKEFKSTWLGCKAVYRSRKIIADGGQLIIIAPGLEKFGEDEQNDKLIRKYGYRGRKQILKLVDENEDLQENLSAAAHLIHGSSNGRFQVEIACQYLSREDIEGVNFSYLPFAETCQKYDLSSLEKGRNIIEGEKIYFIDNPATGLWDLQ